MTDIVLKDADIALVERIRAVADARGWTLSHALLQLLEQGLRVQEHDAASPLDAHESSALSEAIAALELMPDDQFAKIGKLGPVKCAESRSGYAVVMNTTARTTADEVIAFWREAGKAKWFNGGDAFDAMPNFSVWLDALNSERVFALSSAPYSAEYATDLGAAFDDILLGNATPQAAMEKVLANSANYATK